MTLFSDPKLVHRLKEITHTVSLHNDDIAVDVGDQLKFLPITISGRLDIYIDSDDREGFLYSVAANDMCAIGLKCCLNNKTSLVRAYAKGDTTLCMVPIEEIYSLCQISQEWFRFIIEKLNDRIFELMDQLDKTIFGDLSERLMAYLHKKAEFNQSNTIDITHSDIARDLNSSREAVTRLLNNLEQKGILKTSRGRVKLTL
jgi:CRP/FNR family transcriptional regulator